MVPTCSAPESDTNRYRVEHVVVPLQLPFSSGREIRLEFWIPGGNGLRNRCLRGPAITGYGSFYRIGSKAYDSDSVMPAQSGDLFAQGVQENRTTVLADEILLDNQNVGPEVTDQSRNSGSGLS